MSKKEELTEVAIKNKNGELTGAFAFGLDFVLEKMAEAEEKGKTLKFYNELKPGLLDKTTWKIE